MPAPPKIRVTRQQTGSRLVNDAQQQGQRTATALNALALQPGHLLTGLAFSNGVTLPISHMLGAVPAGWILVSPRVLGSGAPTVIEISRDANFLNLNPQGTFTADLWVFGG